LGLRYKKVLIVFIPKTYLITKDLVRTLEVKVGYTLKDAVKEAIVSLEDEFVYEFSMFIPSNVRLEVLTVVQIRESINRMLNGGSILSLDRIYFEEADFYLDITRQTDSISGKISIDSRFGSSPLEQQIGNINGEKPVTLVDVGVFDGDTLLKTYSLLERFGVDIERVVLGVASEKGFKKVNSLRTVGVGRIFDFYEWIELRDLFGIDGRSVASRSKRKFIPYWENLSDWASIQEKDCKEARNFCMEFNKRLKNILRQNGYDISQIGECVTYRGKK